LPQEQLTVFPSGLSILIAIFESLKVSSMSLAGGALREGLIYSLLKNSFNIKDIRNQTIESIISRYQIDKEQAQRVLFIANKVFDSVKNEWGIDDLISNIILSAASLLNELGLCIEYKKASQHAAYIINNIEMPGYTISQKILISALLYNQKDVMNLELLKEQNTVSYEHAIKLARLLRIAIIFAHSRNDDIYKDDLHFIPQGNCGLLISLPFRWLDTHYLRATELKEEILYQKQNDWQIELQEQYA
jgi:exopolyphosphatase/guanosine-5'-triphosphate,3'-diphosphate pyrophosphatase